MTIRFISMLSMIMILTAIFSCETTIDIHLPERPPKLTLNFVGYNNQLWRGRVALSRGVLDASTEYGVSKFELANDVTITLFENDKEMEQLIPASLPSAHPFNAYGIFGTTKLYPVAGRTYRIEAKSDKYGIASAVYRHPASVEIETVAIRRLGIKGTYPGTEQIEISVTFADPAGENYYEVFLHSGSQNYPCSGLMRIKFARAPYTEDESYSYSVLFNDKWFDGKKITMVFKSELYSDGTAQFMPCGVELRNLSGDYFRYLKSSWLQYATRDDPYAQPVQLESNIENGFGIFGGFNQTFREGKLDR